MLVSCPITVRDVTAKAPCQRWKDRRDRYRPEGERIDPTLFGVDGISSDKVAKSFVEQHHYSGSYVAARFRAGLYRAGLLGPILVGVAVFSEPMQQRSLRKWCGLEDRAHGIELGRFVLHHDVPAMGETWFLRRAFDLLLAAQPQLRAVLSYSDPLRRTVNGRVVTPGHVGVIYQAHNGRYMGRGSRRVLIFDGRGRTVSERGLSKIRRQERPGCVSQERALVARGARRRRFGEDPRAWVDEVIAQPPFIRVPHPGNHAYAWALRKGATLAEARPFPRLHVEN